SGLMMHAGRHTTNLSLWRQMMARFVALIAGLRDSTGGWTPSEIDVGGGFAVPRDPFGRADPHRRDAPPPPSIAGYAEAITGSLRSELADRALPTALRLEIEPGRALYGNAGIHLATVTNVKRQSAPIPQTWIE